MPSRLRPTSSVAAEAILVGDPGRALLLAQELLEQPKMSNHARGLWGYSGETGAGRPLTIQSTGMGGPSAGVVLADLAELGVRRAIRVGTCTALDPALGIGELLAIAEAHAWGSGGAGEPIYPDRELADRLLGELGAAQCGHGRQPRHPARGRRPGPGRRRRRGRHADRGAVRPGTGPRRGGRGGPGRHRDRRGEHARRRGAGDGGKTVGVGRLSLTLTLKSRVSL